MAKQTNRRIQQECPGYMDCFGRTIDDPNENQSAEKIEGFACDCLKKEQIKVGVVILKAAAGHMGAYQDYECLNG